MFLTPLTGDECASLAGLDLRVNSRLSKVNRRQSFFFLSSNPHKIILWSTIQLMFSIINYYVIFHERVTDSNPINFHIITECIFLKSYDFGKLYSSTHFEWTSFDFELFFLKFRQLTVYFQRISRKIRSGAYVASANFCAPCRRVSRPAEEKLLSSGFPLRNSSAAGPSSSGPRV